MFHPKSVVRVVAGLLVLTCSLLNAAEPKPRSWTIDGVSREAIIAVPDAARKSASPLVFVFHGHGGKKADKRGKVK